MKEFKIYRVNTLPQTGINGDQYLLRKPNGRYEAYVVQPDGTLAFNKGITDDQNARLERLSSEQISKVESITTGDVDKLQGLKTQSEIDSDIATATSNASASLIPVTGTVLPRGAQIPEYITSVGKAELLGGNDEGGKTFTNTGTTPSTFNIPKGSVGYAYYNKATDSWSLVDMGELPSSPVDGVVEDGNTQAVSGGEVFEKLNPIKLQVEKIDSLRVNQGKDYPFVNPPEGQARQEALRIFNDTVLDVKLYGGDYETYDYSIKAFYKNHVQNGDGLILARKNKSTGIVNTYVFITREDHITSPENKEEVSKISLGGIQQINITDRHGADWEIIVDTDAMPTGLLDATGTDWDNHVLSPFALYPAKVITVELSDFNLNSGQSYPFVNSFDHPRIAVIDEALLDLKFYGGDYEQYTYSFVGIYKNDATYGNGIVLARFSEGLRAYLRVRYGGTEPSDLSEDNQKQVLKLTKTGIQTIQIVDVWGLDVDITLNVSLITDGLFNIGYSEAGEEWVNHIITPANYLRKIKADQSDTPAQIAEYSTFREAMLNGTKGIVKVGSMLAASVVDEVTFPGITNDYKPSEVWRQYKILNATGGRPKSASKIMTLRTENGNVTQVKTFQKDFIYFGPSSQGYFYRTPSELNHSETTHLNTQYEKLFAPAVWPSEQIPNGQIRQVYELDNGEILIEVRNGILEDDRTGDSDRRIQLYLTSGLKEAARVENAIGIIEIQLEGIVSKVHEYKSRTVTSTLATTWSIVGNKIALSPYHKEMVGLVHYSNDYGKTWKVIFNMGVMDETFTVPYKGTPGAWPLPEDLDPPMPSDMWTAGGNTNHHVHGVTIDPYGGRIYCVTGDAGDNYEGRTALWFTDNEGLTWSRVQTKNPVQYDSIGGLQGLGVVCLKNYILVGSDSARDGLFRWSKSNAEKPILELAFVCYETQPEGSQFRLVYSGSVVTDEGHVYSLFHPNYSYYGDKGIVVFTTDGLEYEIVYRDEWSDGTVESPERIINWASFLAKDSRGNIYIVGNEFRTVVKLT